MTDIFLFSPIHEFENLLSSDNSDLCRGRGGVMHIQENHGSNINMIPLTQIHLSQDVKCGKLGL